MIWALRISFALVIVAMAAYALVQLFRVPATASFKDVLLRKEPA
jgi:hypothetical protein